MITDVLSLHRRKTIDLFKMLLNNDELKARIEELQKDLDFYLQSQHELSTRSKYMAMVVEKEIQEHREKIKELRSLL